MNLMVRKVYLVETCSVTASFVGLKKPPDVLMAFAKYEFT
ncbi:hypothetical protein HMPREF0495_00282 [Levilactobacillus brevis ATCC 14869 = DSM 20054]|uniref:Uncharacterized protein n=1 Tax=Levilactobacillus brevis ATCC 14869 = DSM 20054 TaxID=649758 RepID=U2P4N3_LEVBR|nr:hypothetical protein HMPREF0495_00282 [Levilactobacillus brevis ATCC 14869 = DSM 20054]